MDLDIGKLEALSTCVSCITQECSMIDGNRWQLEKPQSVKNLRVCDLKSKDWRLRDPIEMHPLHQPQMVRLMVSGYKPAESKKPKKFRAAGKNRDRWCDLGFVRRPPAFY